MALFLAILLFVLGASLASFAGLVVFRFTAGPAGRSSWPALLGRSRCEGCGRVLAVHELVPVLGWLLASGRCARCGYRVPIVYPATEALAGAALAAAVLFVV